MLFVVRVMLLLIGIVLVGMTGEARACAAERHVATTMAAHDADAPCLQHDDGGCGAVSHRGCSTSACCAVDCCAVGPTQQVVIAVIQPVQGQGGANPFPAGRDEPPALGPPRFRA